MLKLNKPGCGVRLEFGDAQQVNPACEPAVLEPEAACTAMLVVARFVLGGSSSVGMTTPPSL
jgi:hypothetical protein